MKKYILIGLLLLVSSLLISGCVVVTNSYDSCKEDCIINLHCITSTIDWETECDNHMTRDEAEAKCRNYCAGVK